MHIHVLCITETNRMSMAPITELCKCVMSVNDFFDAVMRVDINGIV